MVSERKLFAFFKLFQFSADSSLPLFGAEFFKKAGHSVMMLTDQRQFTTG